MNDAGLPSRRRIERVSPSVGGGGSVSSLLERARRRVALTPNPTPRQRAWLALLEEEMK